jgi:hypothetical protein
MLTLLNHFYNERLMMPYFLRHHVPLFDHGIMIDYGSDDGTVEIIKELAPTWEVRPSRNKYFHAVEIDQEVMAIEDTIPGWKVCLNTTEFILHRDLRGFLAGAGDHRCFGMRQAILFDRPEDIDNEVTDGPLFFQKRYGYIGDLGQRGRGPRFLHNHGNGVYAPGRHSTSHHWVENRDLLIAWFGLCPRKWMAERRGGQRKKIDPPTMPNGLGFHLFWDDDTYENFFKHKVREPYGDLFQNPEYTRVLDRLR